MSPGRHPKGYLFVGFYINGKRNNRLVHRLIASSFIGEINPGMEINHINGIKSDNRVENLEICTRRENAIHSRAVLRKEVGSDHGMAKLTEENVKEIRLRKESAAVCAKIFGVSKSTIKSIRKRKIWRDVQ